MRQCFTKTIVLTFKKLNSIETFFSKDKCIISNNTNKNCGKYKTNIFSCQKTIIFQFRNALKFVVDGTDPRSDLTDYKQIGEGSTGVVEAAYKISTKQIVAVKRMNLRKQQRRELLFNEVSILRQYQHPNIVRFFSSHLVDDELWVVMEFMEGGSLTDIVTATRMTEPQIATISRQVLGALDFLHARKVIHRLVLFLKSP